VVAACNFQWLVGHYRAATYPAPAGGNSTQNNIPAKNVIFLLYIYIFAAP
jgi:hypothetical protein